MCYVFKGRRDRLEDLDVDARLLLKSALRK
jgi:hypothetical protein